MLQDTPLPAMTRPEPQDPTWRMFVFAEGVNGSSSGVPFSSQHCQVSAEEAAINMVALIPDV